MSVSILVVDDEPDVAELYRQRFRRETRQGIYVLHYATSGAEASDPASTRSSAHFWNTARFNAASARPA
jgi:CheY-like chemotaxis protein